MSTGRIDRVLALDDQRPLMGLIRVTSHFLLFATDHIVGISEARHFKFRVLVATEEYYSAPMIDYPTKDVFGVT